MMLWSKFCILGDGLIYVSFFILKQVFSWENSQNITAHVFNIAWCWYKGYWSHTPSQNHKLSEFHSKDQEVCQTAGILLYKPQYCSLLNWRHFWLFSGSTPLPVNWNCVVISPCFAIFKILVHSLESGETPSRLASHQAPNYVQRS